MRHKIKAIDKLSSNPDLLKTDKTLLKLFQSLMIKVSSPDWHRVSVRRWLFKILPKVLEADQGNVKFQCRNLNNGLLLYSNGNHVHFVKVRQGVHVGLADDSMSSSQLLL